MTAEDFVASVRGILERSQTIWDACNAVQEIEGLLVVLDTHPEVVVTLHVPICLGPGDEP
jgi:hypothetical protein